MALSERDTLRVGAEAQKYSLDDWWLPSAGGMAPNTFNNIHHAQRDRFDLFAEWEARWSTQWLSQIGLRSENVRSNSVLKPTGTAGAGHPASTPQIIVLIAVSACP